MMEINFLHYSKMLVDCYFVIIQISLAAYSLHQYDLIIKVYFNFYIYLFKFTTNFIVTYYFCELFMLNLTVITIVYVILDKFLIYPIFFKISCFVEFYLCYYIFENRFKINVISEC